MKIWNIALKDLKQNFRSPFAVIMMLVAPLLLTGLLQVAFGGMGDDDGPTIQPIRVITVNLDQGTSFGAVMVGQIVVDLIESDALAGLLRPQSSDSVQGALQSLDQQEADVVLVLPDNLTQSAILGEGAAAVRLYKDPTLVVGPAIVKSIVMGLVDGFSGSRVAVEVVSEVVAAQDIAPSNLDQMAVISEYSAWAQNLGEQIRAGEIDYLLVERAPTVRVVRAVQENAIFSQVLVGMMIFFVFFTGASTAESIIREDEAGTLARLVSTPTRTSSVLAGKLMSVFATILVQIIVLIVVARLMFAVNWGNPVSLVLMIFALVFSASGFGIFIMSLIKSTRQSGPVMGGVLTLSGMLGGLMTTGVPNLPKAYETAQLFTPHGWALKGWRLVLAGASPAEIWAPVIMSMALGALTFLIGVSLFRKRFA